MLLEAFWKKNKNPQNQEMPTDLQKVMESLAQRLREKILALYHFLTCPYRAGETLGLTTEAGRVSRPS